MPPPGSTFNSGFGITVATLRDIDGGGVDDVAVGAPTEFYPDPPHFTSGVVYVFSGRTGELRYRLVSPQALPGGFFGICVGVGDVDGDGKGDLAVGAPGESGVYVFSGGDGHHLHTLRSPNSGAGFAEAVAALPDVDGDGITDIGVGATGEIGEGGRAYVFSGASGALLLTLQPPNPTVYGYFGTALAGVPDVDGDGVADVIVGKPYERYSDVPLDQGRAYLFSGATGALLAVIDAPDHPAGWFGSSVMGFPDVDGDGRGDFAVGAPKHRLGPGLPFAGLVYLYSGAARALEHTIQSPTSLHNGFGSGLYLGPDLDGDGYCEFETYDPNDTVNGQQIAGRAFIFSTRDGRFVREFHSPHPREDGFFGATAAFLGHSGPGAAPIAFSALGDQDGNPPLLGRAYIFTPCPSDFDFNGTTDSRDFFAFLAAFFTDNPNADFNHDSVINSQDFFDFLVAFFSGC